MDEQDGQEKGKTQINNPISPDSLPTVKIAISIQLSAKIKSEMQDQKQPILPAPQTSPPGPLS